MPDSSDLGGVGGVVGAAGAAAQLAMDSLLCVPPGEDGENIADAGAKLLGDGLLDDELEVETLSGVGAALALTRGSFCVGVGVMSCGCIDANIAVSIEAFSASFMICRAGALGSGALA